MPAHHPLLKGTAAVGAFLWVDEQSEAAVQDEYPGYPCQWVWRTEQVQFVARVGAGQHDGFLVHSWDGIASFGLSLLLMRIAADLASSRREPLYTPQIVPGVVRQNNWRRRQALDLEAGLRSRACAGQHDGRLL